MKNKRLAGIPSISATCQNTAGLFVNAGFLLSLRARRPGSTLRASSNGARPGLVPICSLSHLGRRCESPSSPGNQVSLFDLNQHGSLRCQRGEATPACESPAIGRTLRRDVKHAYSARSAAHGKGFKNLICRAEQTSYAKTRRLEFSLLSWF